MTKTPKTYVFAVKHCAACGVELRGEFNRGRTCRNREACTRRVAKAAAKAAETAGGAR